MYLEKLIKEHPDLNITIKAGELKEFGQILVDNAIEKFIQKKDERLYSAKEIEEKLNICSATRWRWDKMGLIRSKKIGNRVFYPESEIKRLSTVKAQRDEL